MKQPETHWENPQFHIKPAKGTFLQYGPFRCVIVDSLDGAIVQLVENEDKAREWISEMETSSQ